MRISEVAKLFVGSCVVYYVVAACSAYSAEEPTAGPPRTNGDGSPESSVIDPVPNALAEGHKSGTRLKLRFFEGSDGSRQFIDFFDTQLQVECRISDAERTTDDKVRCLPIVAGFLLYSDQACKNVFGYAVAKTAPQPTVGGAQVVLQNRRFSEFYSLGALKNAPAGAVYIRSDGGDFTNSCGQITGMTATDTNFYTVGAPLAPSTFVEMTVKTE